MTFSEINMLTRNMLALAVGALAVLGANVALAQATYPDRPIRMVLPFSAGGGTDVVGRIVARALSSM